MGCDIHLYREFKVGDDPWISDSIHELPAVRNNCINDDLVGKCYSCRTGRKDLCHAYYEDNRPASLPVNCSYVLFGHISGVRRNALRLYKLRGTPDDLSKEVYHAYEWWSKDRHSESFLTLEEFSNAFNVCKEYCENVDRLALRTLPTYEDMLNESKKIVEDITVENLLTTGKPVEVQCRFVFWFDN